MDEQAAVEDQDQLARLLVSLGGPELVERFAAAAIALGPDETLRLLRDARVDAMRSTFRVVR